jgi:hypothetical protein
MDCRNRADGPDEFPTIVVHSESQLRDELEHLRQQPPAIVGLSSPESGGLQIGIGSAFAGITWGNYPRSRDSVVVLADRCYTDTPIDFSSEEDFVRYRPEELIPVEQAIEAIVYFFKNHELPARIGSKHWNDSAKQWETAQLHKSAS